MGRLHHLCQSLPLIASQPNLRCIVVDYGCPDGAGHWVEKNFPQVHVVRASGAMWFNVSKARNMGARHAATPWICFMDADTLVYPGFHQNLVPALSGRNFILARPSPPELSGLVVCRRDAFDAIGGYDELFSGWGCEDSDLYIRLRRSGCAQSDFPSEGLRFISHGDAERTRYHDVADRFTSLRINGMYLQIKTDLARQAEVIELPLLDRQEIFSSVRQTVLDNPNTTAKIDITLRSGIDFMQPPNWRLRRTIRYCFEPIAPKPHV